MRWLNDFSSWVKGLKTRFGHKQSKKGRLRPASDFFVEYNFPRSADEKLKSLSKGQGSRTSNQVSPAAAGPETPERPGRRDASTDPQSKARHRSRSEGPRRGERLRLFDKNDSQGPQWAVAHEPRRSPRPLCLRQFSDDDIPEVNQSGSDSESGDSGPKRWTRNPLLIKKTKKVEKTRATDWKHIAVPPPEPAPVPVPVPVEEKSQTMPTSVGRTGFDSPSSARQVQVIPSTWSNPDRLCSASPKGRFQRMEEMRQQRLEVYPTSDEEGKPHSEISNQIRQRLSQVQAGRGRGRKTSLGEYDSLDNNKSGQEYTNYLKNAGDQMILEPKLNSEVPKPVPMTSSFPSYRPMSTAFSGGSGSLSPIVTSKRDSITPNSEKPVKPRMVVVEYPLRNQQNGGFKLDPKYDANSVPFNASLRNEGRSPVAAHNQNRNSTAIAFGNNVQCIIPSQQQQTQQQFQQQQQQQQQQPPMLPPREPPMQQQEPSLQPQSPMLQPHRLVTTQQTQIHSQQEPSLPQPQPQPLLLQQSVPVHQQQQEPLLMQHPYISALHQPPSMEQRQTFLQQHEQQLRDLQIEHQQQFQQHEQQLKQLQLEHQQQLQQMQLEQHQQVPLSPQQLFVQPDNLDSPNGHIKPFGSTSPVPAYRPVSFQPVNETENGLTHCPPPVEFRTPDKLESKPHRSKPSGSQKRHSRVEPISVGANNSDGGMLLHVPARHMSKSYSDGDSLDELLESNMPYLESGSEINTLQLHRHSMKVIEDSLNGKTTTTTITTDTICVTSQPTSPETICPMPIMPDIQPQLATSPLPPISSVYAAAVPQPAPLLMATVPQMPVSQTPTPEPRMPDVRIPPVTGFSPLITSISNFPMETKPAAASPPTKPFETAPPPTKPFEVSDLGFMDYKPIITISESLLVNDSNKTKRSIDADRKLANENRLSSSSTPSTASSQTLNSSPQPGLCLPLLDAGMFSDVDYDIEVSERVKKWEKYMKTPPKTAPTVPAAPVPPDVKPADLAGDNTLATTVKDMANEWSKYLSVIDEDTVASKPYSSDTTAPPVAKTPTVVTPRKHSLEAHRKVNLTLTAPPQTGSISDSDMYKNKSPYIPTLDSTKSLLQVTPLQETGSIALSRSYHEGAPNKSSSLDSPLFIPARQFSNNSPVLDIVVPARSPVTKDFDFFPPQHQNRSLSCVPITDTKMAGSRSEQPTSDLFEIKMSENLSRRKSDTQAMRNNSQLSPRNTATSDQCNWKNLIGEIQGKLKEPEIWSPQMDSIQGPVSFERVTARTLETIPFSEDPFWKEIEELTNFDQLIKDLPSDPKSPPPPTTRSKVFFPPENTNTSCYQVSMASSQPSHNYSLSSLLSSLTEATAPKKSCSTSNLKTSYKSDGLNALDEVLLDLQPVLGNKLTTPTQNRRYASSTELSNNTSPRRPVSYHSSSYTANKAEAQNPQGIKAMLGSTTEVKDSQSFSSLTQLQESHSSMTYQSMTNLGDKQYENVVNGNYQLDPSVLKEKLIGTGLVERSPSGDELALFLKNSKSASSNVLVAFNELQKPFIQPPAEENIEELKVLARQVEDKLSEIKTKILKADDNNLDKILNTLKTFSPSTSAMLSANVQTPIKVTSRDSYIARKGKLNDAISELEKIYDKLNLGSEVCMEHARSTEFPSSLTGQESHGFRLSSSFSQLYESSHQASSDTFHSDLRFLSSSDHSSNRHYGELPQVPVKDVGSEYPVKMSTSSLTITPKIEDVSGDSVVSSDAPTRRARTRRQRRAAEMANNNQEGRKARLSVNKDENDAPRAYITSVTVERSPRSKSSVRADGMDGGSTRQANGGSRRPKPPPRSSSLHRKPGRDEERSRRKSTPPDFENLKPDNNDVQSQSSNSHTEPTEESRVMPKMMHHLQQQRQELSCSSDSSAETIQQKKRAVSKSIAKMVDLFSSSDEERHKKSRARPKPEQPPISEICEEVAEKVSEVSSSAKSSPKSQPGAKIMTPRSVKQRHDAKRQKAAALAQQTSVETCSAAVSDETPATEGDSSAASKPPLPLRRQRSQSSEKCVSSSEDNVLEDAAKSETHNETSPSERNSKEKSSPSLSNASRNRWSISSTRELNISDISISSGHESSSGKVVIDRAERCRSFHELFASFEPDQKRIEKLRRLQKSVSEEGAAEEGTMRTFRSEPDLRDGKSQINETAFQLSITVND